MFILLGTHVITSGRVQKRRGGDDSKHVNGKINYQLQKICTFWAHILSDRIVFCTARGGGKTAGSNAPGAFLITPPSGRGLVMPFFFVVVTCPRPPLGQNNTCR